MAEDVLKLLLDGERLDTRQMAQILACTPEQVDEKLEELKQRNILLGWRPILNPATANERQVRALIEVRVTPEREGGFDRIAERIARFKEVETCYLMSGGYDLMLIVHGTTLHAVAEFVSARLSSIEGVLSTATHFMLKAYKEQGYLFGRDQRDPDKPSVSP